jgi:hypothetical protein
MTLLWFYFTFAEYLTTYYGAEPTHLAVFYAKISGKYSIQFWAMALFALLFLFLSFLSEGSNHYRNGHCFRLGSYWNVA